MMKTATLAPHQSTAIDIVVESSLWAEQPEAEPTLRQAIAAAASARIPHTAAEVAVVLTDDAAIRRLNSQWRGVDRPTNVLSFPALSAAHGTTVGNDGPPRLLGDIVLSYETLAREAAAEGKPFCHHLAHLAVHGFLHLLGYDHESDGAAEAMETLEGDILAQLGVPDPYARAQA